MDKNKSIDGLMTRNAKVTQKPIAKTKPITTKTAPQSVPEPTISKPAPKSNSTATVEDFLSPVTTFNFDEKSGELTASADPIKKPAKDEPKMKKSKKKPSKKRKIITTILLIIVILLIASGIAIAIWGNDIIAKITSGNGNLWDALGILTSETYEPLKTDANGRTNILAFGTSGYDMDGNEGNGVHDGAQLTDSIMMISINQETGDVAMLSLPRDLKAGDTCTATGKINEVYWCNNMNGDNEEAGATALMAEVGDILGVNFQYYVHLNWGSLVDIVDALGGITVTLDEDIYDFEYTGAVFEAGISYTIDGEEALGLARARHGTTGGDFSRGNSQQKILIAIKDKIYENNIPLTDMINLITVLGDNIRTNLTLNEIKTAAHLTFEFDFNKIRQINLMDYDNNQLYFTTGTINGISYVLPKAGAGNYTAIREFVAESLIEPEPEPEVQDATELILEEIE